MVSERDLGREAIPVYEGPLLSTEVWWQPTNPWKTQPLTHEIWWEESKMVVEDNRKYHSTEVFEIHTEQIFTKFALVFIYDDEDSYFS